MYIPKYTNRKKEVGIVLHKGYGTGWSTSAFTSEMSDRMLFDPQLVSLILMDSKVTRDSFEGSPYLSQPFFELYKQEDYDNLTVEWVKKGELFYIKEYDGYEYVVRQHKFRRA